MVEDFNPLSAGIFTVFGLQDSRTLKRSNFHVQYSYQVSTALKGLNDLDCKLTRVYKTIIKIATLLKKGSGLKTRVDCFMSVIYGRYLGFRI